MTKPQVITKYPEGPWDRRPQKLPGDGPTRQVWRPLSQQLLRMRWSAFSRPSARGCATALPHRHIPRGLALLSTLCCVLPCLSSWPGGLAAGTRNLRHGSLTKQRLSPGSCGVSARLQTRFSKQELSQKADKCIFMGKNHSPQLQESRGGEQGQH